MIFVKKRMEDTPVNVKTDSPGKSVINVKMGTTDIQSVKNVNAMQ